VADRYPEWQHTVLVKLREMFSEEDAKNPLPQNKDILAELKMIQSLKPHMKKLMQFVQHVKVSRLPCLREGRLSRAID